jgi:hypothetical protein
MRLAPIVPPSMTIGEAIALLLAQDTGAVLAGDPVVGRADGIVTGRDLLAALTAGGAAALTHKLETVMSQPVSTMAPDALLHRALARMQRLGVRRLAVADTSGRVVGLLSLRDLLAGPGADALALDDRLEAARSPRELAAARNGLPALVRALRADGVAAAEIAAVVSVDLRELLARAAAQAEKRRARRAPARPYRSRARPPRPRPSARAQHARSCSRAAATTARRPPGSRPSPRCWWYPARSRRSVTRRRPPRTAPGCRSLESGAWHCGVGGDRRPTSAASRRCSTSRSCMATAISPTSCAT